MRLDPDQASRELEAVLRFIKNGPWETAYSKFAVRVAPIDSSMRPTTVNAGDLIVWFRRFIVSRWPPAYPLKKSHKPVRMCGGAWVWAECSKTVWRGNTWIGWLLLRKGATLADHNARASMFPEPRVHISGASTGRGYRVLMRRVSKNELRVVPCCTGLRRGLVLRAGLDIRSGLYPCAMTIGDDAAAIVGWFLQSEHGSPDARP